MHICYKIRFVLKTARKLKKRSIYILIIVLVLPFIFGVVSDLIIEHSAKNRTFNSIEKIKANNVGLLLGTSKYRLSGGINLYFQYRIDAAVKLFNSGKIDFILVSGDNGTKYYNEPAAIKKTLLERGIPENKIILDYAGFRTLDSVIRAKEVFGQDHFTIISQQFHNERAIYLAKSHGIDAIGFNAEDVSESYGIKTQIREYFARGKAVLDVVFHVEPKYLGGKIDIQ